MLMVLQPACLLLGFVLLTEPCLNPAFKPSLKDKANYLRVLSAVPKAEWNQRFSKAVSKSLFGTGVVQAWFVARLTAYTQQADIEHKSLLEKVKSRSTGNSAAAPANASKATVGNFIRQLESVSVSMLLSTPIMIALAYLVLIMLGTPVFDHKKQTLVLATHLALLLGLPLAHVLGLPPLPDQLSDKPSSSEETLTPTNLDTSKLWSAILNLRPRPSYTLALFYPIIFGVVGTLLSAATLTLDWDTPWQTYPFPLLVGSLFGLALGNLYVVVLMLFG
ncbi:hypothetical protein BCV70DRAFT_158273 [Testicularia cyperi]|uniref:Glycosylphosphatidylinositol anchor biosynthesis protein 11 n=1 Tax=Testicularia cyperi TaxID=1882483 RepID=A0A317XW96_9BASI|nr:hypothetical protein BCV70DRAFT_158273 [Testicularia cyperi]